MTMNTTMMLAALTAAMTTSFLHAADAAGDKERSAHRLYGAEVHEAPVDHVIHRHVELTDDGNGATNQIEVQIEVEVVDDEVRVIIDGRELPADRIVRQQGQVIILDEQGNPLETVQLGIGAAPGHMRQLWIGDLSPQGTGPMLDVQEYEEPKVMLGISLEDTPPALVKHLGLEPDASTMITGLYEGLPAHDAGLEEFDVITAIDGLKPANPAALREAMADRTPGQGVRLSVISAGRPRDVVLTLEAYDRAALDSARIIGSHAHRFGMAFDGRPARGMRLWLPHELRGGIFLDGQHNIFHLPGGTHVLPDGVHDLRDGAQQPKTGAPRSAEPRHEDDELQQRLAELEKMLSELLERVAEDR